MSSKPRKKHDYRGIYKVLRELQPGFEQGAMISPPKGVSAWDLRRRLVVAWQDQKDFKDSQFGTMVDREADTVYIWRRTDEERAEALRVRAWRLDRE